MTRYISRLTFTEKGTADIRDSTHRARAFEELAAKSGATVEGQYWTVGSHDGILVLSANKEGKILHLLSELASRGYVRTKSMRAFNDAEFESVLKA